MEKWNLIIYSPAYNVAGTVNELIKRTNQVMARLQPNLVLHSFLIVDDCSTDRTVPILRMLRRKNPYLKILIKPKNEGPIKAIEDGFDAALSTASKLKPKKTIFVRMDSDLEHNPEDLSFLILPIMSDKADATVGYVLFNQRNEFMTSIFNRIIGRIESKRFLGLDIPQFCPGFFAMRGDFFYNIHAQLKSGLKRFRHEFKEDMLGIDLLALVLAKKLGCRIIQIRLSKIDKRFQTKKSLKKTFHYFTQHLKIEKFLNRFDK